MTRLEKASHIAQIISALAVVVSIVYLAVQIKENTTAVSFDINQGLLDLQFQSDFWDKDPDHVDVLLRGLASPDSLNEVEQWQTIQRINSIVNVWWLAFLGHEKGIMDNDVWYGWDVGYRDFMCEPLAQWYWEERGFHWAPSFKDHVNQAISECAGSE